MLSRNIVQLAGIILSFGGALASAVFLWRAIRNEDWLNAIVAGIAVAIFSAAAGVYFAAKL